MTAPDRSRSSRLMSSGGIRERGADLAPRVLGFRTELDILTGCAQAVERAQFTELDGLRLAIAGDQRHVRYTRRPAAEPTRRRSADARDAPA
jgi:hypothetical protein